MKGVEVGRKTEDGKEVEREVDKERDVGGRGRRE